jgi:hypothetical protein
VYSLNNEVNEANEAQEAAERERERFHAALRDDSGQAAAAKNANKPMDGQTDAAKQASKAAEVAQERRGTAQSRKFQGDLGEQEAAAIAVQRLDLVGEVDFTPGYTGYDGVYRDRAGHLVVLESKFTDLDIDKALKDTKYGPQMSETWVQRKAELMHNDHSKLYTPGNDRVGIEVLDSEPGDVRRITVLMNPGDLTAQVYEADAAGNWRQIDEFSVQQYEAAILPEDFKL